MKTIELFCASPASTAICSSMDQRSMIRRGTSRPIDHRHSHLLGDRKIPKTPIPCSSDLPFDPKVLPYHKAQNRSSKQSDSHIKSLAEIADLGSPPLGSSRNLSSKTPFLDLLSNSDHFRALVPSQPMGLGRQPSLNDHSSALKSSSTQIRPRDQVVELRVAIHCKGCEGKVRKHISRMEGVTSFSIDIDTKKVTIIGDVTPLGVLTSISRVKNAQFWPSPTSSSSSSSSPAVRLRSQTLDLKKPSFSSRYELV